MKKLLVFILAFWGLGATAQTTLNFSQVPASPDFPYTPWKRSYVGSGMVPAMGF